MHVLCCFLSALYVAYEWLGEVFLSQYSKLNRRTIATHARFFLV